MSEILRVDRVELPRWGRASGFKLDLPEKNFVVLYGPNESGKTSVATALAWLIAGPGQSSLLHRFGKNKEVLEAKLIGLLGPDDLKIEVKAKVPARSSRAVVKGAFITSVGGVDLNRQILTARLGGGDFGGYRRLYWVEALEVANGNNLQEDVSVRAVFGGVNPFSEAERLGNESQKLLGASQGGARTGSARQLQTDVEALDKEMSSLSSAKDDWVRIETELGAANGQRKCLESKLREMEGKLRSVRLALQAVTDGIAAKRDRASSALADTPEPSATDRRLHEQLTTARARIGELQAAETNRESTRLAYELAFGKVDDSWHQTVADVPLGEQGIATANDYETSYRVAQENAEEAKIERESASALHQRRIDKSEDLQTRWTQQYPVGPSPEDVMATSRAWTSQADAGRVPTGSVRSRSPGSVLRLIGILLGTACGVSAAALAVAREDWTLALVAAIAAAALVVVFYHALRSASTPLNPEQLRLAERIQGARADQDEAYAKLRAAETDSDKQNRRADGALQRYRQSLVAVGVQEEMIEQFSPHVVRHLREVRNAQLANKTRKSEHDIAVAHLNDVRSLLLGPSDTPKTAPTPDIATIDRTDTTIVGSGQSGGRPRDRNESVHLPDIHDAAEAEALLKGACDRVKQHSAAASAAQGADDALMQAIEYDKSALEHVEHSSPNALRDRKSKLRSKCEQVEGKLDAIKDKITDLEVNKRRLESQENDSARLALKRSALTADIEGLVVRGLGHHLAASLLRDAAERHRKTQQPRLLRRTQEMVREVADWRSVTINPHAPATRKATERTDNLLVDGPRGEHTAQRLSLGARTLLYLALRLATVEEQAEARGVRLPLILDDVLVGLDDKRAGRCLKALAEFSERHQMILLTCHESTKERAEAVGAAILPIPPTK